MSSLLNVLFVLKCYQISIINHCIDSPKGCKALYLERSVSEPFLQFLPPSLLFLSFPYQGLNTLRKPATSFPRGARARKHHGKIFPTLPGIEPGIYRISIRYAAGSATLALLLLFYE